MTNEHPSDAVSNMRAAGKLSVEDEAHLVRLDEELMKRACPRAREIFGPSVEQQKLHYEAALLVEG